PPTLSTHLPDDIHYRELRGGNFNAILGQITIVRTGRLPSQLALYVAAADYGRLKYDPASALHRWVVDFLVQTVTQTVIQVTASQLKCGAPDDQDEAATRAWLMQVKMKAESILLECGVIPALEAAKTRARRTELTLTYARSLAGSVQRDEQRADTGPGSSRPKQRGLQAAALGEARQLQLEGIVAHALQLDSLDLPPDPNHLGSYPHPILSLSFRSWFAGLKEGTEVVFASNALGRTKAAFEKVQARNGAFAELRRNTPVFVDTEAIARSNLMKTLQEIAKPGRYWVGELLEVPRSVCCHRCGWEGVARHNVATHSCSTGGPKHLMNSKQFSTIERVLYTHDVLDRPQMLGVLGSKPDLLAELGLVTVSAQSILSSPLQVSALEALLCPEDLLAVIAAASTTTAQVYIPMAVCSDTNLLLTLAVDQILKTGYTCPNVFLPLTPADRKAWTRPESDKIQKWFVSEKRNLYMVACPGPPDSMDARHAFFLSEKVARRSDGTGFKIEPGGQSCAACSSKKCAPRQFRKVDNLLDLPPHFSRHIWARLRRGLDWPEVRRSKTPVARR
ncbi:hypothetical protein B0H15DRAFT_955547, partial [Mycena belliarum]